MTYQFVDCRFDLQVTERGEELYLGGHIPGASFIDLERDLSDLSKAPAAGRHPLPDAGAFAEAMCRAGVESQTTVVAYDDGSLAGAARLWWLLRHFGHERAALLRGGIDSWLGELTSGPERIAPGAFNAVERSDDLADADELLARRGDARLTVVDARAPERYRGEIEPLDPVAGRIPGAINVPFGTLGGGQVPPEDLLEADEIVAYCGSGVTACVVLHALHRAGRSDARLYAGSYGEWSRRGLPIATGEPLAPAAPGS